MKAIDYLKEHGLDQSHWGERIIRAEYIGTFNFADIGDATEWTTCACGKLDDGIPRTFFGMPEDDALSELGGEFCHHVKRDDFYEAAVTLVRIENRAAIVLAK